MRFGTVLSGLERCPRCAVAKPLLSQLWSDAISIHEEGGVSIKRLWAVYECSRCHELSLAKGETFILDGRGITREAEEAAATIAEVLPAPAKADDALPAVARRYLSQALEILHAPDAAALMAASAIDAMLKAYDLETGTLYSRIKEAVEKGLLTNSMGEWAHAVRLEANNVRHSDREHPHVSESEAKRVVDFAIALGDFLFVYTARVAAKVAEAEAEKAGG